MTKLRCCVLFAVSLLFPWGAPAEQTALSVVRASPQGEVSRIEEAQEIRVLFSEPMVSLGRIPDPVRVPFFRVTPAISGSFRWSGTRLLIFTPVSRLPNGTEYTLTIDETAASVDGRRLGSPYVFRFTTPTVRLLKASWERKTGRYDSPVLLFLGFNQPVAPEAVAAHLTLRYNPHDWAPPAPPDPALGGGVDAFRDKVERTRAAARAVGPVPFVLAKSWDQKRIPAARELVVLETRGAPPPQAEIWAEIDGDVAGMGGPATPGKPQGYRFAMEPVFFVDRLLCDTQCDLDSYNAIVFRSPTTRRALRSALRVTAVGEGNRETGLLPTEGREGTGEAAYEGSGQTQIPLDGLGVRFRSATTYRLKIDKGLAAADGQTLGYDWARELQYGHQSAFTSFGTGHGVWEATGGTRLPFYARNVTKIDQWAGAVTPENLVATALWVDGFRRLPNGKFERVPPDKRVPPLAPVERVHRPEPDVIENLGFDLARHLSPKGFGIVWAGLRAKESLPWSKVQDRPKATLVQVTDLGISVKDSPQNTLVLVTRLSDGLPVEGAEVELRTPGNRVFRKGLTDRNGVLVFPSTDLRSARLELEETPGAMRPRPQSQEEWESYYGRPDVHFVVTARKGEDRAYALSRWNEGLEPWEFGLPYGIQEAKPVLRGTVFADRGVYKLGEEVHWKAILRSDTANGMRSLPAGAKLQVTLRDSRNREVDQRILPLSEWGSADWAVRIPEDGSLGHYGLEAKVEGQEGRVYAGTLVASYRRPDFRVDAALAGRPGEEVIAGSSLAGSVTGRYLFGAPMSGRSVRLTYSKMPLNEVPRAVRERYPEERFAFLEEAWREGARWGEETVSQREEVLGGEGAFRLELATDPAAGRPFTYTLEGEVTDVSRQSLAGRASIAVHPASWYIGVRRPSFFVPVREGLKTQVVAVTPTGGTAPDVAVSAVLRQVQWNSVRRAEGNGFYTWESERVEKERWKGQAVTAAEPVPLEVPLPEGGFYILALTARDSAGRTTTTTVDFYALGPGYTAWERYDHNRIDLLPEKKTYRPGETARLLIKSPWEKATALLTTEREGIRTHREFRLTSTQQTVEVPVTEAHIPNVYVSVLLIKGRTSEKLGKDGSDPGKPALRLGYTELRVENSRKRLAVSVKSDREEYRPSDRARIDVEVKDADGKPAVAEVTLWAVDYGVLSLTGYRTPDVLESVYVRKFLQVRNEDSRQRLISRRVIVPKGGEEGGGGGLDEGAENKARKDFRVLAFWVGSAVTDAKGRLTVEQRLPESLTTYRIMAVANDKGHRFGWAEREIRLSKPVLVTPAFPRFLALGDRATFGGVVHNSLAGGGAAQVSLESLTPEFLAVTGSASQVAEVPARGAKEISFGVEAKGAGLARVRLSVKLLGEEDAFELSVPVRIQAAPEVVAAYGVAAPEAKENLSLPAAVLPGVGGLFLELSSTALVGLGEGARYLVDYPYGCAEQRASSALALLLAADLGEAFRLPGLDPAELRAVTRKTLRELESFQCDEGGFVYWRGASCAFASPYLTSYAVHVLQRAAKLGHEVSADVLTRAYGFLERALATTPPANEAYLAGYTSWQAFAVKVLAEGGRRLDSHVTRLYGYRDRLPVYGLCHLRDALAAAGETGPRPEDLLRRIRNAVLPEGGTAHVEDLNDPYLLWFWNSNARSTAIALGSLVRNGEGAELVPGLVRWLMAARERGRWGNTQENAWALESLVDYYRRHEAEAPDFQAAVSLGLHTLVREAFRGRSTEARTTDVPMRELLASTGAGEGLPLAFRREGTGTLHYVARLRYADAALDLKPQDLGFGVERRYEPVSGGPATTSFQAGELVQVVLTFRLPKERRWVAVTDPLPAGLEPVESWFATTARDLARREEDEEGKGDGWRDWWEKGGFDHVERHDDRVLLFATRLSEGEHTFRYTCRATTAGTFRAAPARAEEMYEPEVFGRSGTAEVEVKVKDER